ncbi:hypothetical protein GW17_00042223 [Ensete ventricosum]|nr:hypothetical protein GW17_00042223 [Ensete ventricosum]
MAYLARGYPTYRAQVMHRSRGINLIHGIIGRLMAPIRSRDQEMSYRDMTRITRYMLIHAGKRARKRNGTVSHHTSRGPSTGVRLNLSNRGRVSILG